MKGFRLSSVLRARQAQEDSARGGVLRARRDAEAAQERVRLYEAAVNARPGPDTAAGTAFAAAMWARQAMAADLSAAIAVAGEVDGVVRERMDDLTAAATRRRTVEKLGERHAEAQRRSAEAVAQRESDDLTNSARRRIHDQKGK